MDETGRKETMVIHLTVGEAKVADMLAKAKEFLWHEDDLVSIDYYSDSTGDIGWCSIVRTCKLFRCFFLYLLHVVSFFTQGQTDKGERQ